MTTPPAPSSAPVAARVAIGLVAVFAAACGGLAVGHLDDWGDVAFFTMLGVLAANLGWCLARREPWAWQACCWIAFSAASIFGILGALIGFMIGAELVGWDQPFLVATPTKVAFWGAWMLLLVVIPAAVGYALTRPSVREWYAGRPTG